MYHPFRTNPLESIWLPVQWQSKVSSPSQKKTFEKVWFENEYYIDEHGDEKIKWSIASLGLFWQVQFKSISLLVIFC